MSRQPGCNSKKLLFAVEVPTLTSVLVNNSILSAFLVSLNVDWVDRLELLWDFDFESFWVLRWGLVL